MEKEFLTLVNNRQSCRDFNDLPIDRKTLEKIVEIGRLAPSACNSQPWKMYVVTDEEIRNKVAKTTQDCLMNKFVDKAKAFIVLAETCATLKERAIAKFSSKHFVKYDIGELIAYLTLGAESLGVSSCIIGWVNEGKLKEVLSMPKDESVSIVIALGYSDIEKRPKARKDKEKVVKFI